MLQDIRYYMYVNKYVGSIEVGLERYTFIMNEMLKYDLKHKQDCESHTLYDVVFDSFYDENDENVCLLAKYDFKKAK